MHKKTMFKVFLTLACLMLIILVVFCNKSFSQTAGDSQRHSEQRAKTHLVDERPVSITAVGSDVFVVDFGRVAFGNVRLTPSGDAEGEVVVHFGESVNAGRANRKPPGTVRYNKATIALEGASPIVVAPPADKRNTQQHSPHAPPAILTPPEWGVVLPFRWLEIEGWNGELLPEHVTRQAAYASNWDDEAAAFESSDEMLNQIWELCRYTIKATTFAGVYVDGDRERILYEADAYLNQLSHYYTDNDIQMARDTFDHLMVHGTWPTEWAPHMIFMAYADWMHTGDTEWLTPRFQSLKSKLLLDRVGADGLVESNKQQIKKDDIIDWPPSERDGYVRTSVNTVVNAFHLRAMTMMAEMASAISQNDDARKYADQAKASRTQFLQTLFDSESSLFRDGSRTKHVSLHGNLFPLAFELVADEDRETTAKWLARRGMKCSVYGAQYLLEALFENAADAQAVELITAANDRSWRHMVESGTTLTWEAWDQKHKPNQDWNHAWGAAPANLLLCYILGAQPRTAGWKTARIRPCLGGLGYAKGTVPTPRGPIFIDWKNDDTFQLSVTLPEGMNAQLELPIQGNNKGVFREDKPVKAHRVGDHWILDEKIAGFVKLEVK